MDITEFPRRIHLLGGHKALDYCDGNLAITNVKLGHCLQIPRLSYSGSFSQLKNTGFEPISCELLDQPECIKHNLPGTHFTLLFKYGWLEHEVARPWQNCAHNFESSGESGKATSAGKLSIYLKLVSQRIKELSDAYNTALTGHLALSGNEVVDNSLHSSIWATDIDSSLHSFFADAASLRDALAEAIWYIYLEQTDDVTVTRMRSLISKTRGSKDKILIEVHDQYRSGWIHTLSKFRNEILHKAPVASYFGSSSFQIRGIFIDNYDNPIPMIHYPFASSEKRFVESVSEDDGIITDEDYTKQIKRKFEFANNSTDALELCHWIVESAAKLSYIILKNSIVNTSTITLTDDDLVGDGQADQVGLSGLG